LTALFALTLALGAGLLFAVQPMVARMALPILGGTPAVWNTCMVFFQGTVLVGYALAHALANRTCPRPQVGVYLLLMAVGAASLPVLVPRQSVASSPGEPLLWLLGRLGVEAGLPAIALGIAAPLLQRWYRDGRSDRQEPYFLYAASNIGSFGALLLYPALIERWWSLAGQSGWWSMGYGVWMVLVLACGARMLRGVGRNDPVVVSKEVSRSRIGWRVVAGWVILAAIPASLLQGCTLFLTTDIASVPLLWVIPLSLYLLSFVIAFARRGGGLVRTAGRVLPFLAVALLFAILVRATQPVAILLGLHLAFLFFAGLVCHGRLVATRPSPVQLTLFYLALGIGGVLGGAFNVFVAPMLFTMVAEYPMAIALGCAALPPRTGTTREGQGWGGWLRDGLWATGIAGVMLVLAFTISGPLRGLPRVRDSLLFGVPAITCCALLDRPRRLAMGVGFVFAAGFVLQGRWTGTLHAERNFFGITRVTRDEASDTHQLFHGNTIHGRQYRDPARRLDPAAYYHREGPVGRIFDALGRRPGRLQIGVIGLGVGGLAAYGRPEEDWTFYEIDPAVIRVAHDTNWFTYLAETRARSVSVVRGDGRLSLEQEADGKFDLLIVDAFSSDSIPVHLLTREALQLYGGKLRANGWLVAHISNRYLALEPVFATLAREAGWACRSADDTNEGDFPGKEPSHWIWMARRLEDMGRMGRVAPWVPAEPGHGISWTDQRSSIIEVFEWK
jgi:hypothetical protein